MKIRKRVFIDCSNFLNEIGCTLLISGSSKEVFRTALQHAIDEHGHKDTAELRKQIKTMINAPTGKRDKNIKKGIT